LIQVQHVTKVFPGRTAVSDVSFEVEAGEILGFLGPNGAGKTTTLRIVTGFLPPTHGTVFVGGSDVVAEPLAVKKQIGYLPEHVPLYQEMRVREYLSFRASLKGVARHKVKSSVGRAVDECILGDVRDRVIGQLSKGYKQRVGLADALVSDPPILILDEPTIGLDPAQIREIRKLIKELGRERTVVLSTHILPEVEMICDRVVIISDGRLVGEGTPDELKKQLEGRVGAEAEVRAADFDPSAFESIDGVLEVESTELGEDLHRVVVTAGEGEGALEEDVFRVCVDRGWILRGLRRSAISLEDIFVEIVAREPEAEEEEQE
jgi:ABC-2 type transport system ATP-binding protein